MNMDRLKEAIRDVPDFPKPGIVFKDITPILNDPLLLKDAVALFADHRRGAVIHKIAAVEARGFIFGATLAVELGAGFVPVRKIGKLPHKTIEASYDLEYGSATLAVHEDAIQPGERVLIVDDLLATGGTAKATIKLIEQLGGTIVGADFLVELLFLNGRSKLSGYDTHAFIVY
jgi:adenine phosphoribosyltransferase